MIVSVSGYNWSGSSAVMDLLKEYEETVVITEPEWYLIDQPDGIRDLEFHTSGIGTYFNGDVAIQRFIKYVTSHEDYQKATRGKFFELSMDYLDKLIQEKWRGCSVYDYYRLSKGKQYLWKLKNYCGVALTKITKKNVKFINRDMYLCIEPDNFYPITRKYISSLIYAAGGKSEKVNVVKQLFPANNPEDSFAFVEEPYVIVVDRDPRDIFVQCAKIGATCFPTKDVRQFVEYYKSWRTRKNKSTSERILWLQFEDLDYRYQETVKKIEDFLKIKNHISPQKYFDPEKSIKTTNIFGNYPEYAKEIEYIEKHLSEYLYNY